MVSQSSNPPMSPPAPSGPLAPVEGDPPQEMGFFQKPWVQTVLPFITSLTVHAGILVLALVAVKLVVSVGRAAQTQEQTIIPEATPIEDGPPGEVPNTGIDKNPFTPPAQDESPDGGKPEGWANKAGPQIDLRAGGAAGDPDASPIIGLGAGGPRGGPGGSHSNGDGSDSGPQSLWGFPGGGAIGPRGPVFGNGGNARRIVFVCDGTGSMLNKMASLKNELAKAVSGLKSRQSFDVIFFHDEKLVALNVDGLEPATPEGKRKTFRYLDDLTATGVTDPLPAIETAFRLQPELIYFLSDAADFPDNKAVLELCRKMNPGHKIKVNTILFYESQTEADQNKDSEDLMVQIAKEAGGNFKHVIMTDLEN